MIARRTGRYSPDESGVSSDDTSGFDVSETDESGTEASTTDAGSPKS